MRRWKLVALLTAASLAGCHVNGNDARDAVEAVPPAPTLESYSLPAAHADQVFELVRDALEFGPRDERGNVTDPVARVVRGPGDTLIVLGPPRVQDGVGALIEKLSKRELPAEPVEKTVEVTYWLVRGLSADKLDVPARLAPATKALEAIAAEHGPMRFQLVERTFVRSVAGSNGEAEGRYLKVKQALDVREDGAILGFLNFGHQTGELRTQVALEDGRLLVVGETGAGANSFPELGLESASTHAALFYVVRGRVL